MNGRLAEFDQPAWLTMASTFVGWALMLAVTFAVFFLVPALLWP